MSNFDYHDTEAAHQSEHWDGYEYTSQHYSRGERKEYVTAKCNRFTEKDLGKYVIVRKPCRNKDIIPILYLVNRSITKRFWWSPDAYYAMVFNNKATAENTAKRYKYNNVKVIEITKRMANKEWFNLMYT